MHEQLIISITASRPESFSFIASALSIKSFHGLKLTFLRFYFNIQADRRRKVHPEVKFSQADRVEKSHDFIRYFNQKYLGSFC